MPAPCQKPASVPRSASLKQIDAGELNVGYVEAGPADGRPVILLHGWPYDIHSYVDVSAILAARGLRVIVPHLRGFGTTRFLSGHRPQRPAVGDRPECVALMDALNIPSAVLGGYDWGARTAGIVAALWPERCTGLVAVSGYLSPTWRPTPHRCRRRPNTAGGTSTTSPPSVANSDTATTPRFQPADLADRLTALELRRRHLRPARPRSTIRTTPTSSSTTTGGG